MACFINPTLIRFLISSLSPPFSHYFFTSLAAVSTPNFNNSQLDKSNNEFSGIAKAVTLKCSHLWDDNKLSNLSLQDYLVKLSCINPKTARRYLRFSKLEPQDVLEILLGFESYDGNFEQKVRKIESLWGIFKWASDQSREFSHDSQACKIMVSMLVEARMFRDAEMLLGKVESRGILLEGGELFSNLIVGYVDGSELKRAISVYDQMRGLGLVPLLGCYHVLLNKLVQFGHTKLAFQLFLDMARNELGFDVEGKQVYQKVIQRLCIEGKVQEARNLVKEIAAYGLKPNSLVVNAIASVYCEKKDYDDLLSFFAEIDCAPNACCGNMIINSLCKSFGTEEAFLFLQELDFLGFIPDEITFGILIACACRQSKLKDAFVYLSEILSRGLKPHIYSYNALIGGVFRKGMWNHAKDILDEMNDRGITPELSTFKVLLAGFCRARQYDEVRLVVREMEDHGMVQLSPTEDFLSKAHLLLGFNSSSVKVRRDNEMGLSRTEFFDNIGNGLYLDTDIDKFENTTTKVLDDSMIPDINNIVLRDFCIKNPKRTKMLVDDVLHWGQDLSLSVFSEILNKLCASRCGIRPITDLLERFPKLSSQLDMETLNVLVEALIKRGHASKAKIIFDEMVRRRQEITNNTYTVILKHLCRVGGLGCVQQCWELARVAKWVPEYEDFKVLIDLLFQRNMLKEALELFETMTVACPHMQLDLCHAFLEYSCSAGFTLVAHALTEEMSKQDFILDGVAYSHLLIGFCKEKRTARACMLYDMILAKNLSPKFEVLAWLIPELCRTRAFNKITNLRESILTEQPLLPLSINNLMNGFCKAGMVGEAANLLQYLLLKGVRPHDEVYNILLQGFCQNKNFWKVAELLGFVMRQSVTISTQSYRRLVSVMCMEGRYASALNIKEFMLRENESSHELIYNILIFYLFLSGNVKIVNPVLEEMQERGFHLRETTYNLVVYGLSCGEDVSRALDYLGSMMSKGIVPSNRCFRAVIKCLCRSGELQKALKLSQEMESLGRFHASSIQYYIVEGLLTRGNLLEAVNFLDRMENKDLIPKNIVYDNIIKLLTCRGRQDKAVHLLDLMLRNGSIPSSTSYDYLIQCFVTCHKLNEALDLHSEMLHRKLYPSTNTWNSLIQKVCEDGKPEEAEALLHFMVRMGEIPVRETYCTVIDRYCSEKNYSKASELLESMKQQGYEPEFETQWSLIRHLSSFTDNDKNKSKPRFLSRLLSDSGFVRKGNPKAK
ncbi:Pentatricopeptide repeat-containing protein [Heracleum sosnowskyi]|uniref:Pentatricopeptide repeat-containing protein n=1 Tax=Heracleum sosnowskyi TaxID=360622 RepID=A0AAD8H337_9APIA|nr:Pentatricopeptide repeat-containing protein [Heracleum sosnowskyi]